MDSAVPIGGPVTYTPNNASTWMSALLTNPNIPASNVNFLSYHHYTTGAESAIAPSIAASNGRAGIPIFISEWNADPSYPAAPLNGDSTQAISYVGRRMCNMLNIGYYGSALYAGTNETSHGFYSGTTLYPKASTYRLMSVQMGMGSGNFPIKNTTFNGVSCATGGTNSLGQQFAVVANDSASSIDVPITFTNLGISGNVTLSVYRASASEDASSPIATPTVTVSGGSAYTVSMPPYSVVGVRM